MRAISFILLYLLGPFAGADEKPKHLRFVGLGVLPAWKNYDDLLFRENEKQDLPPREISLLSGESLIPVKIALTSFTELLTVKTGTEALVLKNGNTSESPDWLQFPAPTAPLSLGVLFRDHDKKSWDHPRMLLLKDDAESFPVGTMRFVNVSDRVMVVKIGGPKSKPFGLAAGKSSIKPVMVGVNSIEVGYLSSEGGRERILDNDFTVEANQRVQCFFYKAEPGNEHRAVRFYNVAETIPKLPAP